jgi:hypothetical protein
MIAVRRGILLATEAQTGRRLSHRRSGVKKPRQLDFFGNPAVFLASIIHHSWLASFRFRVKNWPVM